MVNRECCHYIIILSVSYEFIAQMSGSISAVYMYITVHGGYRSARGSIVAVRKRLLKRPCAEHKTTRRRKARIRMVPLRCKALTAFFVCGLPFFVRFRINTDNGTGQNGTRFCYSFFLCKRASIPQFDNGVYISVQSSQVFSLFPLYRRLLSYSNCCNQVRERRRY